MSQNPNPTYSEKLGVGAILSESFSIFFRNLAPVMMLGFLPALIGLTLSGALNGWGFVLGDPTSPSVGPNPIPIVIGGMINLAIYGVTTALLVQLAYSVKLGRGHNLSGYLNTSVQYTPLIVLLAIVPWIGVFAVLAAVFLLFKSAIFIALAFVLIALWLMTVLVPLVPAIVIEKAGLGAFRRCFELTKGFRLAIFGVLILLGICTSIITYCTSFVVGLVNTGVPDTALGIVALVLVNAALTAVSYGLGAIATALIYARLREIKEGLSVDQIAAVFD